MKAIKMVNIASPTKFPWPPVTCPSHLSLFLHAMFLDNKWGQTVCLENYTQSSQCQRQLWSWCEYSTMKTSLMFTVNYTHTTHHVEIVRRVRRAGNASREKVFPVSHQGDGLDPQRPRKPWDSLILSPAVAPGLQGGVSQGACPQDRAGSSHRDWGGVAAPSLAGLPSCLWWKRLLHHILGLCTGIFL